MDVLGDDISEVLLIEAAISDKRVAEAARVSYLNDQKDYSSERDAKLIHYLIDNEHGSVLEHNHVTFRIKSPLFVVQEMLRHRVGVSFNQQSGRYTAFMPEFYIPKIWRIQDANNKQSSDGALEQEIQDKLTENARRICQEAYATYSDMLEMGAPREQASRYLPHATYTNLYVTFNLRSLMHFMHLRSDKAAQWEIRQYSDAFYFLVRNIIPDTMNAWTEHEAKSVWSKKLFKQELEIWELVGMLEECGYDTINWQKMDRTKSKN